MGYNLESFPGFNAPLKWIRSCHKGLEMYKKIRKKSMEPPNPTPREVFRGYVFEMY